MDLSWVCPTHSCVRAAPSNQSQHRFLQYFIPFRLLVWSREWEGRFWAELSVGVSQVRALKAAVCAQEAYPCEVCSPVLRNILHLAKHQETHTGKDYTPMGHVGNSSVSLQTFQAPKAAHWRETLQKQSLICEELQILCVRDALYLQGG